MRRRSALLAQLVTLAFLVPLARGSDLAVDGATDVDVLQGATAAWSVTGTVGAPVYLIVDVAPGPGFVVGVLVDVAVTSQVQVIPVGTIPAGGVLEFDVFIPTQQSFAGLVVYAVAAVADMPAAEDYDFSNGVAMRIGDRETDLAGNPLVQYPYFEYVRSFNAGAPVTVGIDPTQFTGITGGTVDIYVVAHKSRAAWDLDPSLIDVSGDGADEHLLTAGGILPNTVTVDAGTLSGDAFTALGVGYDIVVDINRNGVWDGRDLIDGYDDDEAGLYVVHDVTQPGPLVVTEILYSGGSFLGQNTFYPTNIAELGQLPLVVVSHGNGHNYQWYDHIGNHLASYGYVVMSHQNNTQPGVSSAATTTLTNTDYFLGNLDIINGGVLDGHVDGTRITWIGHSRGGEGIAIAYDRIIEGQTIPVNYQVADVRLLSSIAPTAFQGDATTNPHAVDYHLWVGGADADVSGCPSSNATQSFHVLDRAEQRRLSISLHGVGHGDFHNSTGSVATGPCLVGKTNTHKILRGYLLPLIKHHINGNRAAEDFLWRQWESFRPIGAPTSSCVVVDLQYRQGDIDGRFIIDDFQTNEAADLSSSGGAVAFTVSHFVEDRLDDPNTNFTNDGASFNGFTQARNTDTTRGVVFDYANDADLAFAITDEGRNAGRFEWLSFRACQVTRDPLTTSFLGDTDFSVQLEDGAGGTSVIHIGAYGGGLEEPYQRTSCGTGAGWGNEFETIRLRLKDFLRNDSGVDLADIVTVRFLFGPTWGTNEGRLGLDDLEFTAD